jgi:hypothetical protein
MGADIYYFYHGFGLKAFEGHDKQTMISQLRRTDRVIYL